MTLLRRLGVHGDEDLRGAAIGRHTKDSVGALPENDGVVSSPAGTKEIARFAQGDRRATRHGDLLQLPARPKANRLTVRGEERVSGGIGAADGRSFHLFHLTDVELIVRGIDEAGPVGREGHSMTARTRKCIPLVAALRESV